MGGGAGLPQGEGSRAIRMRCGRRRLLACHAREHGPAEGHACLSSLAQGTVCKILDAQEVKPHKVRYYLERRDPAFAAKMAEVLCVYRKVNILKKKRAAAAKKNEKPSEAVTIISYDEKPGIQAIATTASRTCCPSLACTPPSRAILSTSDTARSSLLAGIDLHHRQGPCPGQGPPPQPRVHRLSRASRCRLSDPYGYPTDPRQSFRPHLQGDQSLARHPTGGPLRVHLHTKARLLAQSDRGLLLQARPLRPAAHPRHIQAGTQGPHQDGRHGSLQREPYRPLLVLQTRQGCLI